MMGAITEVTSHQENRQNDADLVMKNEQLMSIAFASPEARRAWQSSRCEA